MKRPTLLSCDVICIKIAKLSVQVKYCRRECFTFNLVMWLIFSCHLNIAFFPVVVNRQCII